MGKHTYEIGAKHSAYGIEGIRRYVGTERGAKTAAARIAKSAGHGWRPLVTRAA